MCQLSQIKSNNASFSVEQIPEQYQHDDFSFAHEKQRSVPKSSHVLNQEDDDTEMMKLIESFSSLSLQEASSEATPMTQSIMKLNESFSILSLEDDQSEPAAENAFKHSLTTETELISNQMDMDIDMDMNSDMDMDIDMDMSTNMDMDIDMDMSSNMDMDIDMDMTTNMNMDIDMEEAANNEMNSKIYVKMLMSLNTKTKTIHVMDVKMNCNQFCI